MTLANQPYKYVPVFVLSRTVICKVDFTEVVVAEEVVEETDGAVGTFANAYSLVNEVIHL